MTSIVLVMVLFLAWSNGSNDNFKGVATLYGSGTASSRYGLPVSTTHVATGGLFGIGTVNRTARWKIIATILLAWATTLPVASALGAASLLLLRR